MTSFALKTQNSCDFQPFAVPQKCQLFVRVYMPSIYIKWNVYLLKRLFVKWLLEIDLCTASNFINHTLESLVQLENI